MATKWFVFYREKDMAEVTRDFANVVVVVKAEGKVHLVKCYSLSYTMHDI